ncbi:MAG: aminotransferase class IV [Candidatus Sumerlaeaceae bacterium]
MILDWNGQLVLDTAATASLAGQPSALADGLYETLRCYGGMPFDLDTHLRRLQEGCSMLRIEADIGQGRWRSRIQALLEANEMSSQDARIRIVVHRSSSLEISTSVNMAILVWPLATHAMEERRKKGLVMITAADRRLPTCRLFHIKSLNLLATAIAQQEAKQLEADDALFLNAESEVCEATYSNLFAVPGYGYLRTPPLSSPCLAGVTRMHVMRLARREGWKVEESPLSLAELEKAEEMFLTSSVSELMPVIRFNGNAVGEARPGATFGLLQERYSELVQETLAKASS